MKHPNIREHASPAWKVKNLNSDELVELAKLLGVQVNISSISVDLYPKPPPTETTATAGKTPAKGASSTGTKKDGATSKRRAVRARPQPQPLPQFKHTPWYDHVGPSDYLSAILLQMGDHGLERCGYGGPSLAPYHSEVLTELLRWQDDMPGDGYAQLTDWRFLNLDVLRHRALADKAVVARPRIVITAEITTKRNLTVRWYPKGYLEGRRGWGYGNLLETCRLKEPVDFIYFTGDDPGVGSWTARPSNELMFIRDVGKLHFRPGLAQDWGTYNHNSLTAALLCAVRASFNQVIAGLRRTFDVTLFDDFDFDFIEEPDPEGWREDQVREVITGWRLIDVRPKSPAAP
jgi:hypothetical protein